MNTRPLASTHSDHEQWEKEMEARFTRAWDLSEQRLDGFDREHDAPQDDSENNTPNNRSEHRRSPDAHEEPSMSREPSFFVKTVIAGFATLITTGIIWITGVSVSTANKTDNIGSKVDALLARPAPVPLSQYESDIRQIKEEQSATRERVKAIEDRQVESLNRYKK